MFLKVNYNNIKFRWASLEVKGSSRSALLAKNLSLRLEVKGTNVMLAGVKVSSF